MADSSDHSSEPPSPEEEKWLARWHPHRHPTVTQQEFLDNLQTVPVESLEDNNRTCGYCWRTYGESNPGEDDAEAPVQFICSHVFGENCMRSLFAIQEPPRVELKPLSFAPGSRGEDLGSHLTSYVESRGVLRSALLTGGNREKDFARLLKEALPPQRAAEYTKTGNSLLGSYWYGIYYEMVQMLDTAPEKIHLLENAIIFDHHFPHTEVLPLSVNPACQAQITLPKGGTLGNPLAFLSPPAYGGFPFLENPKHLNTWPPAIPDGESTISDSSITDALASANVPESVAAGLWQAEAKNTYTNDELKSLAEDLTAKKLQIDTELAEYENLKAFKNAEESTSKESEDDPEKVKQQWKEVLEHQSKLDDLIAKHTELQVKAAKIKEKPHPTTHPSWKPTPTPEFYYPTTMPDFPDPKGSIPVPQKGTFGDPSKKTMKPGDAYDSPNSPSTGKSSPDLYFDQQKKLLEQQRVRRAQLAREREKRHNQVIERLAHSFAEAYAAYERYQHDQAVAAGRPPPIKKLRLAEKKPHLPDAPVPSSSKAPPSAVAPVLPKHHITSKDPATPKISGAPKPPVSPITASPASPSPSQVFDRPRTVRLLAIVCDKDKDLRECLVSPPRLSIFDEDTDDDEDDERDGVIDADRAATVFADKTILLWRKTCPRCFQAGPLGAFIGVPDIVWWKVEKKGPDDCPRCRRLLFRRT